MIEFVHPGFLWALPAVLLPVIIHLLNRRRYTRMPWAAMEFLLSAERLSRRRIRWQNILLLVLRCAAVLLLVLLFARPYVSRAAAGAAGLPSAVVVLLDDSSSMAHGEAGVSAFDRAREFALTVVERAADERVAIYLTSRKEPVVAPAALGPAALVTVRDRIAALKPSASVFDPAAQLAALGAESDADRLADARFYVVTDLRAADWGERELDPDARRGLELLQQYGQVTVVDVGSEPSANVGVVDILSPGRLAYARTASTFRVVMQNDGPEEVAPAATEVRLDGQALPAFAVPPVPAGEKREALLQVFADAPGYHSLDLSIRGGDGFPADDRRFFAFEAVGTAPVLIMEGGAGDAYYLKTALQPVRDSRSGIRPEVRAANRGLPKNLGQYAAVSLCNVASPATWLRALTEYVGGGGRLVCFLGENVRPGSWNGSLLDERAGLLPSLLQRPVHPGPDDAAHLTQLDFSHPALQPFADWDSLFAMPTFTGFFRLEPLSDTEVLARFDDGYSSPAILSRRVGDGVVLMIATSADDAWTDWPRSEAGRVTYLTLMQWLVEFKAGPTVPRLNLQGGERFEFPLDGAEFRQEATLRPPGDSSGEERRIRAEPREGKEGLWFAGDALTAAGIWELGLRARDGSRTRVLFAVNVPDRERRLARIRPELFERAAPAGGRLQFWRYDRELLEVLALAPARYWPTLAGLILCLLLVEGLLAYRIGNPGGALPADKRRRT